MKTFPLISLLIIFQLFLIANSFCQIFDNELINNVSDRGAKLPTPNLVSPDTRDVDVHLNPIISGDLPSDRIDRRGMSIEEISNLANAPRTPRTFNSPTEMTTGKELYDKSTYTLKNKGFENNDNLFIFFLIFGFVFFILLFLIIFKTSKND
jgi:hypothetical protein